jgi:vacuolar-type H+-ATPase subunit I/STV1
VCVFSCIQKSNVQYSLAILINTMEDDESNEIPSSGKRKRNQSEIALKWWSEKRVKIEQHDLLIEEKGKLVREVDGLLQKLNDLKSQKAWLKAGKKQAEQQRDSLCSQNEQLSEDNKVLKDKLAEAEECKATLSAVTDPLRDYGRFIKITDKNSIIMAVGGAIVGLLFVIMKKT